MDSATPNDPAPRSASASLRDPNAREELITRFYPRVRALVHRQLQQDYRRRHQWILPLFSTGDIVQEVFCGVVRSLQDATFDDEDAFVSYLATLVRNRITDELRFHEAARRDARRSDTAGSLPGEKWTDPQAATPAGAASTAEQIQLVREAIDGFPERERKVLELRLIHGETFGRIAADTGYASKKTARQAFLRCHARLLVHLQRRGVGRGVASSLGPTTED
ncbi:MAG: sigma-70 family RNA polymerase sigma factor [Planctomycetota bacterium]